MYNFSEKTKLLIPKVTKINSKTTKLCSICNDKAMYVFYGCLACDSCRVFFRRNALQNSKPLQCSFNENCLINKKTRKDCSKCRYNKCLQKGMRQDLIVIAKEERKKKQSIFELKLNRNLDKSSNIKDNLNYLRDYDQLLNYHSNKYFCNNLNYDNSFLNNDKTFFSSSNSSTESYFNNHLSTNNFVCLINENSDSCSNSETNILENNLNTDISFQLQQVISNKKNFFSTELENFNDNLNDNSIFNENLYNKNILNENDVYNKNVLNENDVYNKINNINNKNENIKAEDLLIKNKKNEKTKKNSEYSNSYTIENNYNWKKRKIQDLNDEKKEKKIKKNDCRLIDIIDSKRFNEVIRVSECLMKNYDYKLNEENSISESQLLEALKWKFFGIIKHCRAFEEMTIIRNLNQTDKKILLMANCTYHLMLSSIRYYNSEKKCWDIYVKINNQNLKKKMPVPITVMNNGNEELASFYVKTMENFNTKWLNDPTLITIVYVICLFTPNKKLNKLIQNLSYEYESYLYLLEDYLLKVLDSDEDAKNEFVLIKKFLKSLTDFKNVFEASHILLDIDQKNQLYQHLNEQLFV